MWQGIGRRRGARQGHRERPRSSVGKRRFSPVRVCHSSIMSYVLRPLFQQQPERVGGVIIDIFNATETRFY